MCYVTEAPRSISVKERRLYLIDIVFHYFFSLSLSVIGTRLPGRTGRVVSRYLAGEYWGINPGAKSRSDMEVLCLR